jgi:hypothetical protein
MTLHTVIDAASLRGQHQRRIDLMAECANGPSMSEFDRKWLSIPRSCTTWSRSRRSVLTCTKSRVLAERSLGVNSLPHPEGIEALLHRWDMRPPMFRTNPTGRATGECSRQ